MSAGHSLPEKSGGAGQGTAGPSRSGAGEGANSAPQDHEEYDESTETDPDMYAAGHPPRRALIVDDDDAIFSSPQAATPQPKKKVIIVSRS